MQPLTRFQIELVDAACDGGRRARTQRLLDRPQRVVAVRGFHQDQAGRIETERAEAMAIRAAAMAQPVSRQDKDNFFSPLTRPGWRRADAGENRRDEAEGGRRGAFRFRDDLMQGATVQATVRQVGIKGAEIEGQGRAQSLRAGQEAAEFFHDCGAGSRDGKGG
jgi:hypothetical protein